MSETAKPEVPTDDAAQTTSDINAVERTASQSPLSQAWEAFRQKRLEECTRLCKPHLGTSPESAGYWALHGLVLQRQALHRAAIDALRAALAFGPNVHWVHHAIAISSIELREFQVAIAHLRAALSSQPDSAEYLVRLGIALQEAGKHAEAEFPLKRAVEISGENPLIHFRLGVSAQNLRELEKALQHYSDALRLSPLYEVAFINQGAVLCDLGRFEEGLAAFQRAIDLSPQNADIWLRRASAFFARGIIGEAIRHAQRAVQLRPGLTDAHVLLGKLYASQGRMDAADKCFSNALRMQPGSAHIRISQAVMLERRGEVDSAKAAVDAALIEIPHHPQLLLLLGRMAKDESDRREAIRRIEERLNGDPPPPKDSRVQLQYVLGGLYDRERNAELAFANLAKANAYRRDTRPFSRQRTQEEFQAIKGAFSQEFLKAAPRAKVDGEQMIFIVGMPRSGTSLTEQIIAAHPRAFGSGELTTLDRIARFWPDGDDTRRAVPYPGYLQNIDAAGLTEIAYRYLNRLPHGAQDHMRVTDKMPYNFMHVGMISLLFPGARIVHCIRHPVDTTFSCFLQDFLEGNAFSNSLEDCGWFYGQYMSLMEHWRQVLPNYPMLELRYEDLIADPEPTICTLLDFCGLEWHSECLSFHKSRRLVHTASYQQVREPLYSRSVGRWKAYEPFLEPLLKELAPYLSTPSELVGG